MRSDLVLLHSLIYTYLVTNFGVAEELGEIVW